MKNIAIILSGGVGTRFGQIQPKQFSKLAGKAIIEYTIDCFEKSSHIHEIIVVSQSDYSELIWNYVRKNNWQKVSKVVHGGNERFYSSYSALQSIIDYDEECKVLFHDAVRPLVDESIIQKCIQALNNFKAVDVVINSADTLVEVQDDGCISNIPNRSVMRRGQTPQAFHLATIRQAYEKAMISGKVNFTCDCSVLRAMLPAIRVMTVDGHEDNIKITHPIDLFLAEKLLQERSQSSASSPTDLSFLRHKNIVIFGGSSGIGQEMMNIATLYGAKVYIASRSHNNVDVTNLSCVKSYLKDIVDEHGDIDYVINTSGVLIKKPLDKLTMEEVSLLVNVNYLGVVNVAIAAKDTLARKNGMLLNFASSSYTRGRAFYALYSSAKAAVVNLTQALSEEWIQESVRVNCINPERTATPMRKSNFGLEPIDTLLTPRDVASKSLAVLAMQSTGVVIDIKKDGLKG
ncbi:MULTISPECIES: bifunctional cytidylyltransferase/SDR family oxidoreductase [Kluyvera]|uniref:4-diphosphocytidyl-2C-methyl-D-erythritol synthase n=1 Tax=Kluyvera genomosp. 3 TaxID=2774055 RepID=A0A6G9REN3_9ENTR|nr:MULTISPECIES: bifunctional cytidylyltransferase/SDR family oxidoreductase [Kluyvera]QIR25394.1 bifunctional cytidylyltransferase/SDR family oxidoreductase [Kluyvera genomosp. 3]UAK21370.1 bifunctional cytidylyltransferase/SDR family oxidoreductase [Kluyvera sp. CRP]